MTVQFPIKLDLRNLTQDMVDEALPNRGECTYTSPCIIGALMTPEQREAIRDKRSGLDGCEVSTLVGSNLVQFAYPSQLSEATALQNRFDKPDWDLQELLPEGLTC